MKVRLYKIDLEYIKFLHFNYDNRVQYNESRGVEYNQNRPYVGVVLDINGMKYFAPLEHPRPEHRNLNNNPHIVKIKEGRYGLIGLNNMIPVHKNQLIEFDINEERNKNVLTTQFIFIHKNIKTIREKALKVYEKRTQQPNQFEEKVYCDFKKLEKGLVDYCTRHNINSHENEDISDNKTQIERMEKIAKKTKKEKDYDLEWG